MNESNFGNILREARERSGEDLMSVARKLRIRPDILESIEAGDLSNMPPRGYSRNMINAYARYLGLNPTNLVDAYLSQQYQDQVERARKNIRPTGFDMPSGRRHHGLREEIHADERSQARAAAADRVSRDDALSNEYAAIEAESSRNRARRLGLDSQRSSKASRSTDSSSRPSQSRSFGGSSFDTGLFDDIDRGAAESRELSSAERAIAQRPPSTSHSRRAGAVHVGSYNAYGQGLYNHTRQQATGDSPERTRRLDDAPARPSSRRSNPAAAGSTRRLRRSEDEEKETYMPRQSRRSALPEEHSISVYAAPSNLGRNKSGIGEKLPFLIAGIIILLLVVVIAFLANGVGSKATSSAQQSTPMNITGLPESSPSGSSSNTSSDSESSDSQSTKETTTKKTETAPTKAVVAYSVAKGETPYVEIYEGNTCLVAENLSGGASDSYDVTDSLTIVASPYDGLTVTVDGQAVDLSQYVTNGILRYEVNFSDILAAWNEAHPDAASSTSSASSSSNSASTSSTSSSTEG